MSETNRIYCGSGKEKTFPNGGSIIELSIPIDELVKHAATYGFTTSSGRRLVRIKVGRRREVGQYGETHTVEVDTWKPQGEAQQEQSKESRGAQPQNASKPVSGTAESFADDSFTDDIPF